MKTSSASALMATPSNNWRSSVNSSSFFATFSFFFGYYFARSSGGVA
jgi:hypothetical protein